ncbi:MAG: PilZ domain-containing protein [Planctomycetes bacterium]|nr:PilZ domain-containing protein [Planctomycetota bacterium]
MSFEIESERKEFVRIRTSIPVRYKFLSRSVDLGAEEVYEGTTSDLSGSGLLLSGKVPSPSWIPALLMGKILIGANLILPSCDKPLKVLSRVAWVESMEEGNDRCAMGLRFQDVEKEVQDEILKYVIKVQMTKSR